MSENVQYYVFGLNNPYDGMIRLFEEDCDEKTVELIGSVYKKNTQSKQYLLDFINDLPRNIVFYSSKNFLSRYRYDRIEKTYSFITNVSKEAAPAIDFSEFVNEEIADKKVIFKTLEKAKLAVEQELGIAKSRNIQLAEDNKRLKMENEKLDKELSEKTKRNSELCNLRSRIDDAKLILNEKENSLNLLKNELSEITLKIKELGESKVKLQKEIESFNDSKNNLLSELTIINVQIEEARAIAATKVLEESETIRKDQFDEFNLLISEFIQLTSKKEQLEETIIQKNKRLNEIENVIVDFETYLKKTTTKADSLSKDEKEKLKRLVYFYIVTRDEINAINYLKSINTSNVKYLSEMDRLDTSNKRLKDEITNIKNKNKKLLENLESESKNETLISNYIKEYISSRNVIISLENRNKELECKIKELKVQKNKAEYNYKELIEIVCDIRNKGRKYFTQHLNYLNANSQNYPSIKRIKECYEDSKYDDPNFYMDDTWFDSLLDNHTIYDEDLIY